MDLRIFSRLGFPQAIKTFFERLSIPVNYVDFHPTTGEEILKDTYKDNHSFQLMNYVYFMGMVDDAAFSGNASLELKRIQSDYDGILVFGVTLKERHNGLLPTRSQLAEITRAFNREFYYTPVVVVFKYGGHMAFANTERLKYKQEWREGEKAGKVSLLRDINIENPHSGHERILKELKISTSGKSKVDTFSKLYEYWQEVFSVNILNKKFYEELSNWYFWATQHVVFPGAPTAEMALEKNVKLNDLQQEHKATNVIRMLTRLLFVWFLKEKNLIPEDLFELDNLQDDILKDISPYHQEGMFKEHNKDSVYYKAILQNLFFATLNCPIESSNLDKRKRGFRGEGYGTHRGIDYLMRYKQYFKNPEAFLEKLNQVVPFLNGGLFECLDDKYNNRYIDGFSDQMTKGEQLVVPDYLFFGLEEKTDLSGVVGNKDKKYKQAAVKGLINILKSYKFTITENTPIEEDVALDPELLGKVFENLLASYNPETKTTARKQTGSFYTPREIVNYMVDESLIAYLKTAIEDWGDLNEEKLDEKLHVLTSFDAKVPFEDHPVLQKAIISALSSCKILDPACGSGAFPMGILQKMVHILQKLDPENEVWKEVQLEKAEQESKEAFVIEDKNAREERLLEINEAFDQSINDADYARKLFLIENCIYGVDIQPIATQISKLRFFISLVVEQRVSPEKDNFGIRPLPNLETKFVTANSLVGIERPSGQTSFYNTDEIKTLEKELKLVRSKLFGARSKETKLKYRERDEELRNAIGAELKKSGWQSNTAEKLSGWDPYDQNESAPFFDPEWMFDISDGFDVVIGNPPYIQIKDIPQRDKPYYISQYSFATGRFNLFYFFIENAKKYSTKSGITAYIVPDRILLNTQTSEVRNWLISKQTLLSISSFDESVFESAVVDSIILIYKNQVNKNSTVNALPNVSIADLNIAVPIKIPLEYFTSSSSKQFDLNYTPEIYNIINEIKRNSKKLGSLSDTKDGIIQSKIPDKLFLKKKLNSYCKPLLFGRNVNKYNLNYEDDWVYYNIPLMKNIEKERCGGGLRMRIPEIFERKKILTRQTADRIIGTIDSNNYYYSNTLHGTAITNSDYKIEFILSILNSSLMSFYYRSTTAEGGKVFAQVKINLIRELPIKYISSQRPFVVLVQLLINLNNVTRSKLNLIFNCVLDSIVFELYFSDHMQERNIDVLKYVERDIEVVIGGREFEKLSDEQKVEIVEQLHIIWSDPNNEVVKRMAQFKEKSPDILKPILES